MARKKQATTKSSDGKHRKETKEERRIRLEKQEEARQKCFKMLPIVGIGLLAVVIAFGLWVRTVPPKFSPSPLKIEKRQVNTAKNKGTPDFMNVDTVVEDAVKEAQEKLKEAQDAEETIEL